jgi:hypothetical protein
VLADKLGFSDLSAAQQTEMAALAALMSAEGLEEFFYVANNCRNGSIRVGIYTADGRRVDKPQDFDARGSSFNVRAYPDDDTYYYCEDTNAIERVLDPLEANTPEAALSEARKDHPAAKTDSIFKAANTWCEFGFRVAGMEGKEDMREHIVMPGALAWCGKPSAPAGH